jgi:hypothetical protein
MAVATPARRSVVSTPTRTIAQFSMTAARFTVEDFGSPDENLKIILVTFLTK